MSRFLWLIRREIWEHKAIWVAPVVVIGCLLLLVVSGNVHLGPIGELDESGAIGELSRDDQVKLLVIVYAGLALVIDMIMGVVAFFYALDSLYADRRDRSVLFWKSLPLSDAETVLSKFAVAAIVIPLVTLAAALVAQLVVATGGSAKLALSGLPGGVMWQPEAIAGGFMVAFFWCVTAILWYAPVIGYLMLASAWAPKGPFLWAVLPPVGLWILERVVVGSEHVGDFITGRLFGLYRMLGDRREATADAVGEASFEVDKLSDVDLVGSLRDIYASPELWLGVAAAAVLLAAAIWVRRYRDETT
ncbi:MAG TPA: ABC-2 transporter permease [Vicinamibacterales bacterium]|nr:ABC-2 transporter permease [Vicinamibacterales bacterium]